MTLFEPAYRHEVLSAGLLPFRRVPRLEVLVAHPGGPLWAKKDAGAWSVIKGIAEEDEEPFEAARREFTEETGWPSPEGDPISLGEVVLKSGKRVMAWAIEADFDPARLRPGTFTMRLSGREVAFPEIDRVRWATPDEARRLLNPRQTPFIDRLVESLDGYA